MSDGPDHGIFIWLATSVLKRGNPLAKGLGNHLNDQKDPVLPAPWPPPRSGSGPLRPGSATGPMLRAVVIQNAGHRGRTGQAAASEADGPDISRVSLGLGGSTLPGGGGIPHGLADGGGVGAQSLVGAGALFGVRRGGVDPRGGGVLGVWGR